MGDDPKSIAEAFLQTYGEAFANADVNTLSSLYAADSIFCLDGDVATGEDIAKTVIGPRFEGGGIDINISSFDAQLVKPTSSHIVILLTGEASDRPAGRFNQVIVLGATDDGGFYIKADIARFSSAGENVSTDTENLGAQFVNQYYETYESNQNGLIDYFTDDSSLCIEGETYEGVSNKQTGILAKLNPDENTRPLPNGAHDMKSLDSVAIVTSPAQGSTIAYSIVCLVTGNITLQGEKNALNFAQSFTIVVDGNTPYCSNDIFRFNYA